MAKGSFITPEDLDLPDLEQQQPEKLTLKEARDRFELQYIKAALRKSNGNVSRAAKAIDITRSTFYSLMEKYNVGNH